jgi:Kef-type K+ transport system membrane component KefB
MALFRALFILAWLLLPLAIVYFIKSPKFRKQVLRAVVSWLVFFAISYLLVRAGLVLLNLFDREGEAQLPDMPPLGEMLPLEPG